MTQALLTYDDYLALPETMQRYEVIDGKMITEPAPLFGHQWHSRKIFQPMANYVDENLLGVVVYAPVDIMISRAPLRTRQPDVLYISFERIAQLGLDNMEELSFLDIAPDLVVEIISPSESQQNVLDKFVDYQRMGVDECWLVRSREGTIEVVQFISDSSRTIERFSNGAQVQPHVLPGWQPVVNDLLVPLTSLKSRSIDQ
jgi:Uma2 family endonuclease